jgi:tetratricopeptide (TPR) repeat protein
MLHSVPMTSNLEKARCRLQRVREYLELDPDNLNLLIEATDLSLSAGEAVGARLFVEHALKIQHGQPFFRSRLSTVALQENNWQEAIDLCEGLLADGHDDPAIRYNLGRALLFAQRYEDASVHLQGLIGRNDMPGDVAALQIRALHYLGKLSEAIDLAQEYLKSHEDDATVTGMLGLLYFDHDDLVQARIWSDRALALKPDNLDALITSGGTAIAAEDTDRAKTLLELALERSPREGRVWSSLGLVDLLALDLTAARGKFSLAVQYMPGHIGTWHALAWVQLLQNDLAEAEKSFQTALALDENFGETHGGLAAVAAVRGEWDKADEHSKIARRLDPNAMSTHYANIIRLQREGHADAAQRLMRSALARGTAPGGGTLLDMLARVKTKNRR